MTIAFGDDAGRQVLLVDGTVQSLAGPLVRFEKDRGYWAAMVPDRRPSRTLLLGLGVGTVARYLHARFGPLPMVGIDDDPSIVAAARQELADLDDLEIVAADAFEWVADARPRERFDLICVDLYRGAQIQAQIVGRPFLRRLRELLASRGDVVFNLFADRRTAARGHRIGRVFRITRTIPVGKNLVVWCR